MFTENANRIFNRSIEGVSPLGRCGPSHRQSLYAPGTIDHLLYHKNWIDTVQWHLEDIIRDPAIDPAEALIKRRIDKSNQDRTDMVGVCDSYLLDKYKDVAPAEGARLNTETPAWAIDRLSILALKIYHMAREAERTDVDDAHRAACRRSWTCCSRSRSTFSQAIEELIEDIEAGRKVHEDLQTDENVQRPGIESGALWAEKIAWGTANSLPERGTGGRCGGRGRAGSARHLLVMRTSAMGDVAMLPHALRALTAAYPDLRVTVATQAMFRPLSRGWMSGFSTSM